MISRLLLEFFILFIIGSEDDTGHTIAASSTISVFSEETVV